MLGHYVKDLSLLNRDLGQTIIVDNSPLSYLFHRGDAMPFVATSFNTIFIAENAIDISSYIDDPKDIEMWKVFNQVRCKYKF